jgi:hypothetical protein
MAIVGRFSLRYQPSPGARGSSVDPVVERVLYHSTRRAVQPERS